MNYKLADGVISVGALGNKIFFSEDNGIYPETCWAPGKADELVSLGFLKRHEDVKENNDTANLNSKISPKKLDEIDNKELRKILTDKKLQFKPNASKVELYQLYIDSF